MLMGPPPTQGYSPFAVNRQTPQYTQAQPGLQGPQVKNPLLTGGFSTSMPMTGQPYNAASPNAMAQVLNAGKPQA